MFLMLLLSLVCIFAHIVRVDAGNVSTGEMNALHALYGATNGDNWRWHPGSGRRWDFAYNTNPCLDNWQGIICNSSCSSVSTDPCTIEQITLDYYRLEGTLPDELSLLTALQGFSVFGNRISGSIPAIMTALGTLYDLSLGLNRLRGDVPLLPTSLITLYIGFNRLSGEFPTSLRTLTRLQELEMAGNPFTGTLPTWIGNLGSLTMLEFQKNNITGTIPSELGKLSMLMILDCDFNHFYGTLPDALSQLTSLTKLSCGNNHFTGSFPSVILLLEKLNRLDFRHTNCSGTLPSNFGVLSKLTFLDMSLNKFSGSIPGSLYTAGALEIWDMGHTNINGTISSQIGLLTHLKRLVLRFCSLSGTLPSALSTLTDLELIEFSTNSLSGTIMEDVGNMLKLKTFDISVNKVSGTIPSSLFTASLVTALLVEENLLTGTLPTALCNLPNLKNLNLMSNFFSSTLPACLGDITFLNTITVSENLLTGTLPASIAQLIRLNTLIINNNRFTGTISSYFASAPVLNSFVLHNNLFSGKLVDPPRLPQALVTIDISSNAFTGTLPTYLFHTKSPLRVLSASDNCFSGALSSEICYASNLSTLVLNGVSSSPFCSREMIDLTHRVYYANFVPGTIPACYFSMPSLRSLYLSGNGLTGTVSKDYVGNSLQNLYMSYNQLTGRIPQALLQSIGTLRNVDLSTNRLSGTIEDLSIDVTSSRINALADELSVGISIYLQNNRISGNIPKSLANASQTHLVTMNILAGNMFSCPAFSRNILAGDPNNEDYVCGSNDLNSMLYLTLVLFGIVCGMCGYTFRILWLHQHSSETKLWQDLVVWCTQYIVWKSSSRAAHRHLQRLADVFAAFRLHTSTISAVALIVFLPMYTTLKYVNNSMYGQYTYQYGWVISLGFMEGEIPAALIATTLLIGIGVFTIYFRGVENKNDDAVPSRKGQNPFVSNRDSSSSYINSKDDADMAGRERRRLFLLGVCNFVIVCLVNGSYVYVLLYEKVIIQFVCTIVVISFKILWNPAIVVPVCRMMHVSHLVTFYILIFNNMIIPVVATAAVDVSCYQSLFVVPETITDRYIDHICTFYANDTCAIQYVREAESTFNPPWIYSFQCSSSVFRNYIAVYVVMYAFIGLVLPVARICIMLYFNECFSGKKPRGSWSRMSLLRRKSSVFMTFSSALPSFTSFGSSFSKLSGYFTKSSTEQGVLKARRMQRKLRWLAWIKSRIILYSLIRMYLPIQSVDDFLYATSSSSTNSSDECAALSAVEVGEDELEIDSDDAVTGTHGTDGEDSVCVKAAGDVTNKTSGVQGGDDNTPSNVADNVERSVEKYFDMKNPLVANNVFYGTTSNCFNLALGLVMLVTFGLAYPPLAVIISMYLISLTLSMQLCLHYHYLQVTSLGKQDPVLVVLWDRIVDIELKSVNDIIFGINQSAALLCALFFGMFFVDMTYTWVTSLTVVLVTIVIICIRIYWDNWDGNKYMNPDRSSSVSQAALCGSRHRSVDVDGIELEWAGTAAQCGDDNQHQDADMSDNQTNELVHVVGKSVSNPMLE